MKEVNVSDPIFLLTKKIDSYKEETDKVAFLRSYSLDYITNDQLTKAITFIDSQMSNLINFCCKNKDALKSLLFADLTFELATSEQVFFVIYQNFVMRRTCQGKQCKFQYIDIYIEVTLLLYHVRKFMCLFKNHYGHNVDDNPDSDVLVKKTSVSTNQWS